MVYFLRLRSKGRDMLPKGSWVIFFILFYIYTTIPQIPHFVSDLSVTTMDRTSLSLAILYPYWLTKYLRIAESRGITCKMERNHIYVQWQSCMMQFKWSASKRIVVCNSDFPIFVTFVLLSIIGSQVCSLLPYNIVSCLHWSINIFPLYPFLQITEQNNASFMLDELDNVCELVLPMQKSEHSKFP